MTCVTGAIPFTFHDEPVVWSLSLTPLRNCGGKLEFEQAWDSVPESGEARPPTSPWSLLSPQEAAQSCRAQVCRCDGVPGRALRDFLRDRALLSVIVSDAPGGEGSGGSTDGLTPVPGSWQRVAQTLAEAVWGGERAAVGHRKTNCRIIILILKSWFSNAAAAMKGSLTGRTPGSSLGWISCSCCVCDEELPPGECLVLGCAPYCPLAAWLQGGPQSTAHGLHVGSGITQLFAETKC